MDKHQSVEKTPEDLPVALANQLIPGQIKPCAALVALKEGRIDRPGSRSTKWFVNTASKQTLEAMFGPGLWPTDVSYLPARHVLCSSADPDLGEHGIGVIRLPLGILGEEVYAVDTAFIVRQAGQWTVLPACTDEDSSADDDEESNTDDRLLVTLFPEYAQRWPLSTLRQAMVRSEWAFCTHGHAAFLSAVLDLDGLAASSPL